MIFRPHDLFSYLQIFKSKNDQERSALPLSLSVATERTDPMMEGKCLLVVYLYV